jgi:hypothetical protein
MAQQYANPVDGTLSGTAWDSGCLPATDQCDCISDGADGLGDTTGDSTIVTEDDGSRFACEIEDLEDPSDTTNTFLRCRIWRTSDKANTVQWRLCNNANCNDANDPIADSGSYTVTDASVTLVTIPTDRGTMDASKINSYASLYIDVYATASNPTDIKIADCQLEVPLAGRSRRMF